MKQSISVAVIEAPNRTFTSRLILGEIAAEKDLERESLCKFYYYAPLVEKAGQTYKEAIASAVDRALARSPHIIAPIGVLATQLTVEKIKKLDHKPIIVSSGTARPKEIGLVKEIRNAGISHSFVELELVPIMQPVYELAKNFPNMRSLLLAYNPKCNAGAVGFYAHKIKMFLEKQGIQVTLLKLKNFPPRTLAKQIQRAVDKHDTISFVFGDTAIEAQHHLIDFCKERKINLIADNEESVKKGATVAFCHDIERLGRERRFVIEKIAYDILHLPPIELAKKRYPIKRVPNEFKMVLGEGVTPGGGMGLYPNVVVYTGEDPHKKGDPYEALAINTEEYTGVPQFNIQYMGTDQNDPNTFFKSLYFSKNKTEHLDLTLFRTPIPKPTAPNFITRVTEETELIIDEHDSEKGVTVDCFVVYGCKAVKLIEAICKNLETEIPVVGVLNTNKCNLCAKKTCSFDPDTILYYIDEQKLTDQNSKPLTEELISSVLYQLLVESAPLLLTTEEEALIS